MQHALVYGGSGALGSALVAHFRQQKWTVISVDMRANPEANANILLSAQDSMEQQEKRISHELTQSLGDSRLSAILCVAGGWAGGNAADPAFVQSCDLMARQSITSSVIASRLAASFLSNDGLLLLTGSQAALNPTSGMIGYGMAKAAVHHLARSLACTAKSGLPRNSRVICILPETLDTPANRAGMPSADFSTWTPLQELSRFVFETAVSNENGFPNALVGIKTVGGNTSYAAI